MTPIQATYRSKENSFIHFGTDGWRAVIGDGFTFANLEVVAQAYSDYLKNGLGQNSGEKGNELVNPQLVIIGYDRRFMSEQFAWRTAEVFAGNNLEVALFNEAVPTPLVSWGVKTAGAVGGIVITASHNPAEFNGFKIKEHWGCSASQKITSAVERLINKNPVLTGKFAESNNSEICRQAITSYRRQISEYIDLDRLRATKKTIIIDSMHGAGGNWTESFLQGGNLQCETVRADRDAFFGGVHPEPIDQNLEVLKKRVRETKAILGLATDGDADRLGAVNEHGQTMTMHEVVPILLLHLIKQRKMTGAVVRTFSQSVLTKRIAEAYNLPIYETPIGFKYIADLMISENILIGAEESGGIGVKEHLPERDGIFNSLLLLEAVLSAGKLPSEIVSEIHREFGEFYFDRCDLKIDVERGKSLINSLANNPTEMVAGEKVVDVHTLDGIKLLFADESWLLFRQSGTQPLLRIYAEATTIAKVKSLLKEGISTAHHSC